MTEGWIPYDSEDRTLNPLPPLGLGRWSAVVWIHDRYYDGVTLGRWTQNDPKNPTTGWWTTLSGGDDIGVSHWMPCVFPDPPEGEID